VTTMTFPLLVSPPARVRHIQASLRLTNRIEVLEVKGILYIHVVKQLLAEKKQGVFREQYRDCSLTLARLEVSNLAPLVLTRYARRASMG
jgi:hypothetical protein